MFLHYNKRIKNNKKMNKYVTLYHFTDSKDQIDYLDPDCCLACEGGQKEGIYFWTSPKIYKKMKEQLIKRQQKKLKLRGSDMRYGPYVTAVSSDTVCFPDWRFDLALSPKIIDDLSVGLRKYYAKNSSNLKDINLSLSSQISYWDEHKRGNQREPYLKKVTITALSFQKDKTIVKYTENNEEEKVLLFSKMYSGYCGIADTLVEFLCDKDKNFCKLYNKRLKQALKSSEGVAIKFVNKDYCIPVTGCNHKANKADKKESKVNHISLKPLLPSCNLFGITCKKTTEITVVQFSLILAGLASVILTCDMWRKVSPKSYEKTKNKAVQIVNKAKKNILGLLVKNYRRTQ